MEEPRWRRLQEGLPPNHPAAPAFAQAIYDPEGAVVVGLPVALDAVRRMSDEAPAELPASSAHLALVVLGTGACSARCRPLGEEGDVTFRSGGACELVQGQNIDVRPVRDWTYRRHR